MNRAPWASSLLVLLPLFASFSFACKSAEHVTGTSRADVGKGWERRVGNSLESDLRDANGPMRVAFGTPLRFESYDQAFGPEQCDGNGCQAKCTIPTRSTDSHVTRVTCDIGCSVKVEETGTGKAAIEIIPAAPGRGNVTVEVEDDDGVTLSSTSRFETAIPTNLSITRDLLRYPHGNVYAALPGTEFRWCFGLSDVAGQIGFVDMSLGLGDLDGSSYFDDAARQDRGFGYQRCATFETGESDLVVTAKTPQISRSETIRVVSKGSLVRGEIVSLASFGPEEYPTIASIDADPLAGRPAITDISFDLCDQGMLPVMVRAETADGLRAILPVKTLHAAPSSLAEIDLPTVIVAKAEGEGTMSIALGGRSLASVPLVVKNRCAPPTTEDDAGTDADVDAGTPEDAGTD